jgi:2-polyprenyl-6-methoxyphenol hydroxylase-like FAD-dependent oxidoreductase
MSSSTNQPVRVGRRAVVMGASMGGLCAARALSDRFDEVLVVDRDTLPDDAVWRSQVPQGRHPHLLLVAGVRLLEGWFPGLIGELHGAGAVDVDLSADVYWYQSGGAWRRPATDLHAPAMSRPLLERTVRRRVQALANVTLRHATTVEGLQLDPSAGVVTGVRLGDGTTVGCDLVVDASGRQARSLRWLAEAGYEPPATSTVEVGTRYVTRLFQRTEQPVRDWKAAVAVGDPATKRLGMAVPLEGDRWYVLFGGINGESPPTELPEALAYARTLPSPVIAQVMECSEPIGDAVTHRFAANQRRHVERLRRFPQGWVLLGDSVCSFNPIYGQGMTVAAQQAEVLAAQLDRSRSVDRTFARRYFRAAGRTLSTPWSIAVGGDFAYDQTAGPKPLGTDAFNRYLDRANVAAQHDDAVANRLTEVLALVRRPEWLLSPPFVARVLWAAHRGPAGDGGRAPAALTATPIVSPSATPVAASPGGTSAPEPSASARGAQRHHRGG